MICEALGPGYFYLLYLYLKLGVWDGKWVWRFIVHLHVSRS